MSDARDLPPELPERLLARSRELFRSHGVPPEEAGRILEESAVEAWYRKRVSADQEARFLRAVERRCEVHSEALRRRAMEALDGVRAHRALITFVQRASWLLGQGLRLRFSIPPARFAGEPLRRLPGEALILAPTHEHVLDPWLAVVAFDYRTWRSLAPVRVLGTRDWTGWYRRLRWLIRGLYRLYGVVELPLRARRASREEKLRGLVAALDRGDVAAIFPEGHVRLPGEPRLRRFEPGVVHLHRRSGAPVVPLVIRLEPAGRWRRRFELTVGERLAIPEELDLEEGADWLRTRMRELARAVSG